MRQNRLDALFKVSYKQFQALTPKEQKRITSILVSAMNKRIKRLGKYKDSEGNEIGKLSPTYQAYENRIKKGKSGYYSVKGLTGDELYNRFEALQGSLQKATSVREWKKQRSKTLSDLNLEDITLDEEKAFWNLYRKFQEDKTRYSQHKKDISDKIVKYVASHLESLGYDYTAKTKKQILKFVKEDYEKDKGRKTRERRTRSTSAILPNEESEEY